MCYVTVTNEKRVECLTEWVWKHRLDVIDNKLEKDWVSAYHLPCESLRKLPSACKAKVKELVV